MNLFDNRNKKEKNKVEYNQPDTIDYNQIKETKKRAINKYIVILASFLLWVPIMIILLKTNRGYSNKINILIIQEDGERLSGAEIILINDQMDSKKFITDKNGYASINLNTLEYKNSEFIIKKEGFNAIVLNFKEQGIISIKDTPITKIYKLSPLKQTRPKIVTGQN